MKTRTIIMMLTLVVVGVVIGCSSEPAAPVANLTENEVIELARTSESKEPRETRNYKCWYTEARPSEMVFSDGVAFYVDGISNFSHTASASFKPSGIWIVTVKSSWDYETSSKAVQETIGGRHGSQNWTCTYVVDDATGRVTQN